MKGMLVTSDDEVKEVDLPSPIYQSAGKLLGGSTEHMALRRLERPYCMIVNLESVGPEENKAGCYLYETDEHGCPIFGDILIMKDVWTNDGVEIGGLEDEDITNVAEILEDIFSELGVF